MLSDVAGGWKTKLPLLGFLYAGVVLLLGCPGRLDSLAAFDELGPNPLAFTTPDVLERTVSVGFPSDRVTVLFFTSPEKSDDINPVTTEIAVEFRESRRLNFVSVADLRSLAFYERPFAPSHMRGAHGRTVDRINNSLAERDFPPIEGLFDTLFLIADENGAIVDRYRVPDPTRTITAIVFHSSGHEVGRYDAEQQLGEVIESITLSLEDLSFTDDDADEAPSQPGSLELGNSPPL